MVALGWSEALAGAFAPHAARGLEAGRVCLQLRGAYTLWPLLGSAAEKELDESAREPDVGGRRAPLPELGAVAKRALGRTESGFPVIGDWVAFTPAARAGGHRGRIEAVLPRRTKLSRKVPGERAEEQIVAANVDTVFVMMGLDDDFSLRRLERFLLVVGESGAEPVVVLNKIDLCDDPETRLAEARRVAPRAAVVAIGSKGQIGLDRLARWLRPGRTIALLGSSGVGKSTLVNALAGEELQQTGAVRERDRRGQHTTSFRRLLRLPCGSLLVDNPGMREVQPWSAALAEEETFADIEAHAAGCRFADCRHQAEPGCAVRGAVEAGTLDAKRVASWRALADEAQRTAERQKALARLRESRAWRRRSEER